MKSMQHRGFTLVELLTVIAIISILAGLTFTVAGPMRERARITKLESTLHNMQVALDAYYTSSNTYPAGYGFLSKAAFGLDDPNVLPPAQRYVLKPYSLALERFNSGDVIDLFSASYDGNNDGFIGPSEFLPMGIKVADGPTQFEMERYPEGGLNNELAQQLGADQRPMYYAPVNIEQAKKAKRYWLNQYANEKSSGMLEATSWDPSSPDLQGISFPPSRYDGYALISVGPRGDYHGVVATGQEYDDFVGRLFSMFPNEAYHILALRSYYLASRDLNNNGEMDFDFRARKSGEGSPGQYTVNLRNGSFTADNNLPSRTMPEGYGPILFAK